MNYEKRIKALKKGLRKVGLDAFLITKKENIFYLCGFKAEDALLLIASQNKDFVITDSRYAQKAQEALPDFDIRLIDGSKYRIIKDILKGYKVKRLGFESDWLSFNDYLQLKKSLKRIAPIPKKGLVEKLRIIKDPDEIDLIKESISIVKKAYGYAKKIINPKINGRALAVLIDNFMRAHGAERPAFQTIVAQNPYSSCPHADATAERFSRGCCVLIDMGAVFEGYNSDLTRMVFLGRITSKFKHIYNVLKTSQKRVIEKLRPGIRISELDRIARQHIANKGLGKFFLHSLGHGVGLEIHEPPKISKETRGVLRPGMVLTVEPGIYVKGWGGLRVEDMVAVTEDGCEVLTDDIPK